MPFLEILRNLWAWIATTGLDVAMWIVLALLVPRIGRLIMRVIERGLKNEDENETKTHLAIAGVAIYIAQLVAYFLILVFMLQDMGMSLAGAAIPATAASAALALGAQSIVSDFLAGFFILTERHYGVGDWVRFEGGSTTQEGTVIQITMRATRIRTLSEETVIIPNSKAGVSINNSNYWSSAVLVMQVPLLGSRSISETMQRAEGAAQKALETPAISSQTLGELNMQEPIDVTAPTTVGMPWTVSLRFLCQVKPGSQWMVERAMRTAIIEEFWEEYGSAPTLTGAVANTLTPADPQSHSEATTVFPQPQQAKSSEDPAPTQLMHADEIEEALEDSGSSRTSAVAKAGTQPPSDQDGTEVLQTDAVGTDDLPTTVIAAADAAPTVRLPVDAAEDAADSDSAATGDTEQLSTEAMMAQNLTNLPDAQDPERRDRASEDPAAKSSKKKKWDKERHDNMVKGFKARMHQTLTVGGRTRVSTTLLLLALFVIMLLKGFTYTNEATNTSGWLAPRTSTEETTEEVTETYEPVETSAEPTTSYTPETESQQQQQDQQSGDASVTQSPGATNNPGTTTAEAPTTTQGTEAPEPTEQETPAQDPFTQFFGSSESTSAESSDSDTEA